MCVRIRNKTTKTDSTAVDNGGFSHATKGARGLLVASEVKPTKEKRTKICAARLTRPLN